ncbi:MAG: Serine/threonine-protein kinase PrkC [Planctomycetes bacterium ADurb.Bin126]|nr:MAG: Serine/threonine-protein kinase PrkC [Planctomycetes bacterium ADurb.Bin126]HQL71685.1 protein kinase [Phycisphaerae bacterium]
MNFAPGDKLTPAQQARVDEVAAEALGIDASARQDLVRDRCGDEPAVVRAVLALLAHAASVEEEGFLAGQAELPPLEPEATAALPDEELPLEDLSPRIPGYRVIRPLAAGGMGVIWLVEQENPRREVALKVIRPGMTSPEVLQRFQLESQVLGRLKHPGIAQIYEAGMYDAGSGPQPYFVMEYVQGALPLIPYADAHDLGVRERLTMFAEVCDAVQHAHQKGVVHRDIKPQNILVDNAGQPKILDFGIARATDSDLKATTITTNTGSIMGTLPYMSPEQTTGDPNEIDVRSDVYALGVTLYELLTDKRPYDLSNRGMLEVVRIIREVEPTRLGTLSRALRGDLENILGKAMAKDRERRYASAGDLAEDIRRHLNHEPVLARPVSSWYRLRKFAHRNAGLCASVAVALVLIVALTAWFILRLQDQRDTARRERAAAQQARNQQIATAQSASRELALRAVRAAEEGRWIEADVSAAAAGDIFPRGPWGGYALAAVALQRGDLSAARSHVAKAIRLDPRHELSRLLLATILAREGELAQAESLLGAADEGHDWHSFHQAGDLFFLRREHDKALRAYTRTLELMKTSQRVPAQEQDWRKLIALGDALQAGLKAPDALAAYERAREQIARSDAPSHVRSALQVKLSQARQDVEALKADLLDQIDNCNAWIACKGLHQSIRDLPAPEQVRRIQDRITAMNGLDTRVSFTVEDGVIVAAYNNHTILRFAHPLAGLSLRRLSLPRASISDLTPLKGMPLSELDLSSTSVRSLDVLRGMPLRRLNCCQTAVTDLSPLKGMQLESLDCGQTAVTDLAPLIGMPLETLCVSGTKVRDLSPLRGMKLRELSAGVCYEMREGLEETLRGMPLETLNCYGYPIKDLAFVRDLPLKELLIAATGTRDLSALHGLKLKSLNCRRNPLEDLGPLAGMPLEMLDVRETKVVDLSPLRGMKLKKLWPPPKNPLWDESWKVLDELERAGCEIRWGD